MSNGRCFGYGTRGCFSSSVQLSLVVESSQGEGGAARARRLFNNPNAAFVLPGGELLGGSSEAAYVISDKGSPLKE